MLNRKKKNLLYTIKNLTYIKSQIKKSIIQNNNIQVDLMQLNFSKLNNNFCSKQTIDQLSLRNAKVFKKTKLNRWEILKLFRNSSELKITKWKK